MQAVLWLTGLPVVACNDLPHEWVTLASATTGDCGLFVYQQALELFEDAIGAQASTVVLLPRVPLRGVGELAELGPGNAHNRLVWNSVPASGAAILDLEVMACSTTRELKYDTLLTHGPTVRLAVQEHLAGRFVALSEDQQILAIDEFKLTALQEMDFSYHGFVPLSAWVVRRVHVYDDHRKFAGTWWMGEGQPPSEARLFPADASTSLLLASPSASLGAASDE